MRVGFPFRSGNGFPIVNAIAKPNARASGGDPNGVRMKMISRMNRAFRHIKLVSCLFVWFRGSSSFAAEWNHEITRKDTKEERTPTVGLPSGRRFRRGFALIRDGFLRFSNRFLVAQIV